jgi:hypothetical protein
MDRIADDETFLSKICFSDEATFHLSRKVNRHNIRRWGSENLHAVVEYVRDSLKINVFYAPRCDKVYGSFFFGETIVPQLSIMTCGSCG